MSLKLAQYDEFNHDTDFLYEYLQELITSYNNNNNNNLLKFSSNFIIDNKIETAESLKKFFNKSILFYEEKIKLINENKRTNDIKSIDDLIVKATNIFELEQDIDKLSNIIIYDSRIFPQFNNYFFNLYINPIEEYTKTATNEFKDKLIENIKENEFMREINYNNLHIILILLHYNKEFKIMYRKEQIPFRSIKYESKLDTINKKAKNISLHRAYPREYITILKDRLSILIKDFYIEDKERRAITKLKNEIIDSLIDLTMVDNYKNTKKRRLSKEDIIFIEEHNKTIDFQNKNTYITVARIFKK